MRRGEDAVGNRCVVATARVRTRERRIPRARIGFPVITLLNRRTGQLRSDRGASYAGGARETSDPSYARSGPDRRMSTRSGADRACVNSERPFAPLSDKLRPGKHTCCHRIR